MSENMNAIVDRGFMNPTSLKEGMEMASWIAKSDLAPRDYKDKPQNVLLAMQMGFELGLSPMQAIQNIAVINGRPSIWGDAMLGICQNHRDFEFIDENQSTNEKGVCVVKRRGMGPQARTFTVDDAKKAGLWGKSGPWQTAPARMLKLRARAFALRDTFADALRGLQSAEEQRDVVDTSATIADISDIPMPQRVSAPVEQIEPKTQEKVESQTTAIKPEGPSVDPSLAKKISLAQAKRFFAICKSAGKSESDIKKYISELGISRSTEMPVELYEKSCKWAETRPVVIPAQAEAIPLQQEEIMETPGVGE